jgi:transposase
MTRDPIPPLPPQILSTQSLLAARDLLSPADFRLRLRKTLLANPNLTLLQVARELKVTRQCVGAIVGRLNRSTGKPAIKREQAKAKMAELRAMVAAGESAEHAAKELGISLGQAMTLGFRSKAVRAVHGTQARSAAGCGCWRCRRAAGIAVPRGTKMDSRAKAEVLDLLAYVDPDSGEGLSQRRIGEMVGAGQAAISRIARAAE